MSAEMQNWKLQVIISRPGKPTQTESHQRSRITIGGLSDNDIVLSDPFVSGQHAWVTVARGKVTYHDSSTNGSFVDGQRIEKRELNAGDVVSVPPYDLSFELVYSEEIRRTQQRETYKIKLPPELRAQAKEVLQAMEKPDAEETLVAPAALLGKSFLQVKEPSEIRGRILPLGGDLVGIGRGEEAQIRFDLPTLSRLHATITHDGRGWVLEDQKSANGTYVNGKQVQMTRLAIGDEIILGRDLVMELTGQESMEPTEEPSSEESPKPRASTDVPVVEIHERRAHGEPAILVLQLEGRVDGYNYTELAEKLNQVIDARERFLIIDLGKLEFIDHTGLGVLVNASTRLDRVKGQLRLVGVGPKLKDALELSRVDSLFRGRINLSEAIAIREIEPHYRGK